MNHDSNIIISDKYFDCLNTLIYNKSGIAYQHSNRKIIESKIRDFMRIHNIHTIELLYETVLHNHEQCVAFIDTITINWTRFFRNEAHIALLSDYIIPYLLEKGVSSMHLWSAGCATGEEAYTLGMICQILVPIFVSYLVTGSDISYSSLSIAQAGQYSNTQIKNIPLQYRRYITQIANDTYSIDNIIKKNIIFEHHNLLDDEVIMEVDVVFCRNVLIYFDEHVVLTVLKNIANRMKKDSFLILGHSENIFSNMRQLGFKTEKRNGVIFYKRL